MNAGAQGGLHRPNWLETVTVLDPAAAVAFTLKGSELQFAYRHGRLAAGASAGALGPVVSSVPGHIQPEIQPPHHAKPAEAEPASQPYHQTQGGRQCFSANPEPLKQAADSRISASRRAWLSAERMGFAAACPTFTSTPARARLGNRPAYPQVQAAVRASHQIDLHP